MNVYRVCTPHDLPALKTIWLSCFDEREDAAELFLQRNLATCHAYACESDGDLAAALYLIGCTLNGERAHYLCGAATLPAYRGRGIMSALIAYALKDASKRGDRYSLLLPADEPLYRYYARFGYRPACAIKNAVLTADTARTVRRGTLNLTQLQTVSVISSCLIWEENFIRFAADYYGCYGARTAQSADAFAIYQPDGGKAEVIYALYRDIDALKALLRAVNIRCFSLTGAADDSAFEGRVERPYGMILPLEGDAVPDDVFIGITLR